MKSPTKTGKKQTTNKKNISLIIQQKTMKKVQQNSDHRCLDETTQQSPNTHTTTPQAQHPEHHSTSITRFHSHQHPHNTTSCTHQHHNNASCQQHFFHKQHNLLQASHTCRSILHHRDHHTTM
ncbi:Hypothetical protein CpP54B96_0598 [Corynebacterium pseudotuberculosis P54B96]|nr:Hypothetical protein CpPAT10_0589 [Corynebacterium pseudotuberculosis PAT10]AFF21744.1 Hypothetical protein CpP54B96_0598 [Corynebacterium pseudotuberculosis P54B96]